MTTLDATPSTTYPTLAALVSAFAPIVYYHRDEQWFPASVDWYAARVNYTHLGSTGPVTWGPGKWSWQSVQGLDTRGDYVSIPGDQELSPNPPPAVAAIRAGDPTFASATAYVHALPKQFDSAGNPGDFLDLQYWLFYPFNGAEYVAAYDATAGTNACSDIDVSFHEGDWEQVTVRLNRSFDIVEVHFSEHSTGLWVQPGGFTCRGTQVIDYVARGSHANYPRPDGPWWIGSANLEVLRIGLADYTTAGQQVDYGVVGRTVIVANDAPGWFSDPIPAVPWLSFQGHWGAPLTTSPSVGDLSNAILTALRSGPLGVFLGAYAFINPVLRPIALAVAGVVVGAGLIYRKDASGPASPSDQGAWGGRGRAVAINWSGSAPVPDPPIPSAVGMGCAVVGDVLCLAFADVDGHLQYTEFANGQWRSPSVIPCEAKLKVTTTPGLTTLNGVLWCVFHDDATGNIYSVRSDTSRAWPAQTPALVLSGPSITGSPWTLTVGSSLYCFFQNENGNGNLKALVTDDGRSWAPASPADPASIPGMSQSPTAVFDAAANTVTVLYQNYGALGQLTGASLTGGRWQALVPHNGNVHIVDLTSGSTGYLANSPASTAWAEPGGQTAIWSAFAGPKDSDTIYLVKYDGTSWTRQRQALAAVANTASPTIVGYRDGLVSFFQDAGYPVSLGTVGVLNWSVNTPMKAPKVNAATAPACISDGEKIYGVYADPTGAIFFIRFDGTDWSQPSPMPGATGASGTAPTIALFNGQLVCLYQAHTGGLACAVSVDKANWATPIPVPGVPGLTGSPSLVAGSGALWCVFQNQGQSGNLCVAVSQDARTWTTTAPTGVPGMSESPSAVAYPDDATVMVLYQDYGAAGRLSGASGSSGRWRPLVPGNQDLTIVNLTSGATRYMTNSPAAVVWKAPSQAQPAVWATLPGAAGSGIIHLVTFDGQQWTDQMDFPVAFRPDTTPTLLTYQDDLIGFYIKN